MKHSDFYIYRICYACHQELQPGQAFHNITFDRGDKAFLHEVCGRYVMGRRSDGLSFDGRGVNVGYFKSAVQERMN